MKAGKEHRVPLPDSALAIIDAMAAIRQGDHVFPGGKVGRPISNMAMLMTLRRMGRSTEAEEQLRRAVLIRPDLIGALYNLAVLAFERGAMKDAENYLLRYMRLTSQPNLEALLMGVRIARANSDPGAEESFLQQLRRRFADVPEAQQLLEGKQ